MKDHLRKQPKPRLPRSQIPPTPSNQPTKSNDGAPSSSGNGGFPALSGVVNAETNVLHDYFEDFPPGYRFSPQDSELILDYLQKRAQNQPLPPNNIVEINIYEHNPDTLARRFRHFGKTEWYFFTPRDRKYRNGERPNRAAAGGFWKATGADRQVHFNGKLVGLRKSLVFYLGKPPHGAKTNWIMHEYRVAGGPSIPAKDRHPKNMRLDDCVLCKIYQKPGRKLKPPQQKDQVEDQAAVATQPRKKDEIENVGLPGKSQELDDGCSIVDSLEDYQFNSYGGDEYQHFNLANPFLNPSHHMFSNSGNLPPLPIGMAYHDLCSFGLSQQDWKLNSSLDWDPTSLLGFENPHFSVLQSLGDYINPPMTASWQCDDPNMEGFSVNTNPVSPFRALGFDAPSISNPFYATGFEFDAASASSLPHNCYMEGQVDLRAISPMLFGDNDMEQGGLGSDPPMKKFKQMD